MENRLVEQRANRRISRSLDNSDDPANLADDENTDQAEIPRDSPETEMLNSMNHTPLSIPLVMAGNPNNLALASRNVRSASMENRIPARHSSLRSVSDDPRFSLPADKYVQQYRPAHTTSLDLSRPSENIYAQLTSDVAEHHADAASLQVFYTGHKQPDPLQALRVSEEIDEIAARHSLEISRNGHNNPPHRVAGKMRDYSVAKAAVAAARKRSIEVQFDRQSIEKGQGQTDKISLHSSNVLNKLSPSRGVSTDDDVLKSGSEYVHHGRRSIELTAAMPREELVNRHNLSTSLDDPERDLEAGIVYDHKNEPNTSGNANKSPTQKTSNLRFAKIENDKEQMGREEDTNMNPIQNSKSLRIWNNTILKNLEHQEEAKNAEPAKYPWIVTQLVPRLGRVASPVEKLFWFGSHRFFLWCVQFILFFSTVLLAAATSSLALLLLAKEEKGVTGLNIASSILPPITLLFTLFRTADIIKKYIFILHNASLVPEAMALEAIRNVSKKKPFLTADDLSSESGSETEREEESAKERRRRLGKFFRSEAAQGNVTGIEATSDRPPSAVSAEVPARRVRKRKLALRLRRKKARTPETDFPQIPAFVASANQAPLE